MQETHAAEANPCSHLLWDDAPLVSDLFAGTRSAPLPVRDLRLRDRGLLGDVRAWMEERRVRQVATATLKTLFVRGRPKLDPRTLRATATVDEIGIALLMLPPTGRVACVSIQEMEGRLGYCGGYLSPEGWLWTDQARLSDLASITTGNARFAAQVAA